MLTFVSKTTINIPNNKFLDEVIIDMKPVINYRFEGSKVWLNCLNNDYVDTQTLNITHMDKDNNVLNSVNADGDICCVNEKERPYCLCHKCRIRRNNNCQCESCVLRKKNGNTSDIDITAYHVVKNDSDDDKLPTITENVKMIPPKNYRIEKRVETHDVIVIDSDDNDDTGFLHVEKPVDFQQKLTSIVKKEKKDRIKRVRWEDQDNETLELCIPKWSLIKSESTTPFEYRRKLQRHTLRRSARLADRR